MPEHEHSMTPLRATVKYLLAEYLALNIPHLLRTASCPLSGNYGRCVVPLWLGKMPDYQESGHSCLSGWLLGSVSVIKPGGDDSEWNKHISRQRVLSYSLPISKISTYGFLMQNVRERHQPLASMGQGCSQLCNSIYSSHFFDALGSEIQVEENQSDLINSQALTPPQVCSSLVARTYDKKSNFPQLLQRGGRPLEAQWGWKCSLVFLTADFHSKPLRGRDTSTL